MAASPSTLKLPLIPEIFCLSSRRYYNFNAPKIVGMS